MDDLIKKATRFRSKNDHTAADYEVAEDLLKPIKALCRSNDDYVREAARFLLMDMQQKNIVARHKCLCVMDCLFTRSHLFRTLICDEIRLLAWSAGLLRMDDKRDSAAAAMSTSEAIKEKVKFLVEIWDLVFGQHYSALRALARYFRESLKLKMPNVAAKAHEYAVQRQHREEQDRLAVVLRRDKILRNARADLAEIESNVTRLDECFMVIFPTFEDMLGRAEQGGGRAVAAPYVPREALEWVRDGEVVGIVGDENEEDEEEGDEGEREDETHKKRQRCEADDICWEDASDGEDEREGQEQDVAAPISLCNPAALRILSTAPRPVAAPFQLELTMRTSLQHVETPDNAVVVQVMRELCKYLGRHALPMLRAWQTSLADAVALGRAEEGSSSSSSSGSGNSSQANAAAAGVLKQCAGLAAAVLKVLRKCKGIYDDEIKEQLRALGEAVE